MTKYKLFYLAKEDRVKMMRGFFGNFGEVYHYDFGNIPGLIRDYKRIKPDVFLCHHNRLVDLEPLFAQLRYSYNIYWRNDERYPLEDWFAMKAKYFHLFLMSSDDSALMVSNLYNRDAQRFMMGFKPQPPQEVDRDLNIVFTGQKSRPEWFPLSGLRADLVEKLRKKRQQENDFHIFGRGWGLVQENENVHYSIYHRAKIGLAINHYNTSGTYSNRMYQIMTCGAMCLCYETEGIKNVFGDNIVTFNSYDDMIRKIDYYLKNDKEREAIARSGKHYVNNTFTWDKRGMDLINIINEKLH